MRAPRAVFAGIIGLAFLARLDWVVHPQQDWDTAWFLTLGRSFAANADFVVPWTGQVNTYWPPLFPMFLAPLVKVFGASYHTALLGSALASALLTTAVFFTTRDLMGSPSAWAAAALVACCPIFLVSDSLGMSESLVALCATLAVWAFLRSLQKPVWLVAVASFGVLFYLSKATIGLPLIGIVVVAFLAWRTATRRMRMADLAFAGGALAGLVVAFVLRGRLGGVGIGLLDPVMLAARDPVFVPLMLGKLALASAFLFVLTLPFSLHAVKAWRAPRTDGTSALAIGVLLVLATGAVFTATFKLREGKPFFELDNVRYLAPAIMPTLWLLLPHAGFAKELEVQPRHERFLALAVATLTLLLLFNPVGGVATKARLAALALFALVPLTLAAVAALNRERVVPRKGGASRTERVPASLAPAAAILALGAVIGFAVLPVALALAIGLCVALASASPQTRAAIVALTMLGAFTTNVVVGYPADETASLVAQRAPAGSLVTIRPPAVYFGAAAPEGLRLAEAEAPLLGSAAFVTYAPFEDVNWTLAGSFPDDTHLPAGVRARLAIEETLGMPYLVDNTTHVYVYVPR